MINVGLKYSCYAYDTRCYVRDTPNAVFWVFFIICLLTFLLELLNICLLIERKPTRVNLILGEFKYRNTST